MKSDDFQSFKLKLTPEAMRLHEKMEYWREKLKPWEIRDEEHWVRDFDGEWREKW